MSIPTRPCLAIWVILGAALLWPRPGAAEEAKTPAALTAQTVEIPSGTLLSVELVDGVHTGKNKTGDSFRARVLEGVWVRGTVAVPPGTTVRGVLTEVVPSGRLKQRSKLEMKLTTVDLGGQSYAIHTDTLSYVGEPHAGKHWGSWLAGALQGAVYGVLFGGKSGAIIGAGAGAGAGGVSSVVKGKADIDFSQGAKLMFETQDPFSVPVFPTAPPAQAEQKAPTPEKPAGKPAS